jgi:NAD(P)-dependent dehydrogenase (short-subunit alcohol dehydrogenase family)
VGRNREKLDALQRELMEQSGDGALSTFVADMGDLTAVSNVSRAIAAEFPAIDALIHNAGALLSNRVITSDGIEETIASHVVGPYVMTSLLLDALRSAHGRVITVSSGGMYTAALPHLGQGGSLEMREDKYDGVKQYATAKRAQVTLNEIWAQKESAVQFYCMHPGWSDTPGVQQALPKFRNVAKLILRDVAQGADTICWLTAEKTVPGDSGTFWCDRSTRSIHRLPTTKRADTATARDALWLWCQQFVLGPRTTSNS